MAIQSNAADTHLQCTSLNFTDSNQPFTILCWINAVWNPGARRSFVGMYGANTAPFVAGLSGAYFSNQTLTGPPTLVRQDTTVNFDWAAGSPDPSIPVNNFSARWTGFVRVPETGTYTFRLTSDDGCRLFVNGQTLINDWTDHPAQAFTGTINLVAGSAYEVIIEYYENAGQALIQFDWQLPSASTFSTVPALSGNVGTFTTTLSPNVALQIGTTAGNGELTCWTWGGSTLVGIGAGSMNAFNNQWVLISYTYDGTTHRLYRNNQQVATSTTAPIVGKFYWVYINGHPTSATGEVSNHQVGSYSYYGRTLSEGEIETIFTSRGTRHGITDGTLARYDFDERAEGETVVEVSDISGNRNSLTLLGAGAQMTYVYVNTNANANLRPVQ